MRRLTDKLLTVMLSLLLGFSPLQGAVASMLDTPSQGVDMHQMIGYEGEVNTLSSDQMHQDCPQHMVDNGCQTHVGTSNHCSSCVVGLPSAMTAVFTPILKPSSRPFNDGFASHPVTSLYRPPRG